METTLIQGQSCIYSEFDGQTLEKCSAQRCVTAEPKRHNLATQPKSITVCMSTQDTVFIALGFVGGIILSGALIPQVVKVVKSRSTQDISYIWQFTYISGLMPTLSYAIYFSLWPIAAPGLFELTMILMLTGMKAYFEWGQKPEGQPADSKVGPDLEASMGDIEVGACVVDLISDKATIELTS